MKQIISTALIATMLSFGAANATPNSQLDATVVNALRSYNVEANIADLTHAQKVEIALIAHLSDGERGKRQQIRAALGHTVWQLLR